MQTAGPLSATLLTLFGKHNGLWSTMYLFLYLHTASSSVPTWKGYILHSWGRGSRVRKLPRLSVYYRHAQYHSEDQESESWNGSHAARPVSHTWKFGACLLLLGAT